ncbi:(ABC) transporter, partial [Coemansia sp. RSA 2336]
MLLAVLLAVMSLGMAQTARSNKASVKHINSDAGGHTSDNSFESTLDRINKNPLSKDSASSSSKRQVEPADENEPFDYGGFNIDSILDLMAGDDDGNVDFGAIGVELASNLANVFDMNEVGSMATTLGLMLTGIGATNELQRRSDANGGSAQDQAANLMLNSGIAALVGQVLSNQQLAAHAANNNDQHSFELPNAAQMQELLANGLSGADLIQGLTNMQNHMPAESQKGASLPKNVRSAATESTTANGGTRNIASAMFDFVNGNDTANLAGVAQAFGIRNFFQTEEKKIPDGCPSCFNCMYPGSVCAHNATCNQFTGRCDCPSGWTGEDCLQPESSVLVGFLNGLKPKDTSAEIEIDSMLKDTLRATVAFREISYQIPTQGPDLVSLNISGLGANSEKPLSATGEVLKGISGIVRPGELLAILGASGAGKSTLLDILSRREKCGKVAGKVLVNDRDLISDVTTEEFHRMSGYVDQQDLHVATATVYESVMTSALLRLPRAMSLAAKEKRVREVLIELGLWSVRDSKIGKNGARGISGGEMRRVSIACELVTSPSIIFLDEPTSGLDAYNAFVVMDTLSKLARRYGRTVICTIHQPRADIFSMFDQLLVLAAGQMCYSGPAADMVDYLASIGHPVPEGYNVADFSVDLVQQATVMSNGGARSHESQKNSSESSDEDGWSPVLEPSQTSLSKPDSRPFLIYDVNVSLPQILSKFKESSQYRRIHEMLDKITGPEWSPTNFEVSSAGMTPHIRPATPMQQIKVIFLNLYDLAWILYQRLTGKQVGVAFEDKLRPTVYEQFKVISARIFRHLYRDPTLMLANYALSLFIGLMCGVLFYQLDNSVQGMQNRLGLLIFILAFYGFGCTTSLLVFSEERLLYLRERANAYYNPLAYFLAKVTFDLIPLRVVPPLLLTLIAYPMTGLAPTWGQFIKFFCTLVLFNLTVASQMLFIGLLAEELVVSNFLASILLLFSLLFGGLILNKESIPAIFQAFCRFSSFNLAYEALAINELRHAHIEEVRFGLEIQ